MKHYIAFDIGGTMIKYGILEEEGTLLFADSFQTEAENGGKAIITRVCQKVLEAKKKWKLSGIAISTAGMVDEKAGVILYANDNIPGYTGTRVKQIVEEYCQLPCEVENDVCCAALSEQKVGSAKGSNLCLCITVGTGVGGAIIYNGKIFHGFSHSAGNLGYMNVFGKNFESIASSKALVETVKQQKGIKDESFDGRAVFELAMQNDLVCKEAIQKLCDVLTYGIANACCIINPQVIVLGGGIMEQKDYLEDMLQSGLDKYLPDAIRKHTKLTFAKNGNHAGLLGAYYNWKEKANERI